MAVEILGGITRDSDTPYDTHSQTPRGDRRRRAERQKHLHGMEQLPQLLPGGLVVALLDARLDRQDPLGDDSPALDERFIVKVLAGVERVAEIHSHVHQLDEGDGPAEALGGPRDPTGRSHPLSGEGPRLQSHTVAKWQHEPEQRNIS